MTGAGAVPVYLFRGLYPDTADAGVVCAAPVEAVTAAFGGGGTYDMDGVTAAFGGCAYFQNERTGAAYLAVWGSRNASRFRGDLRRLGVRLEVREERPDARMMARITR